MKRVVDSVRKVEDCFHEVWDVVSVGSGAKTQMQSSYAMRPVFNKEASDVYIRLGRWAKNDKVLDQHLVKPVTSFKTKKNMQVRKSQTSAIFLPKQIFEHGIPWSLDRNLKCFLQDMWTSKALSSALEEYRLRWSSHKGSMWDKTQIQCYFSNCREDCLCLQGCLW